MLAEKNTVNNTKLVNHFYPFQKQSLINIAFNPTKLVNWNSLERFLGNRKYLTVSQRNLLQLIFAELITPSTTEDKIHMCISPTGKETIETEYVYYNLAYDAPINISTFVNFIYYKDGSFYSIQPKSFRTQLYTFAFDHETKKINEGALKEMVELTLNSDNKGVWEDLLINNDLKSNKTSLSKILISLLPSLTMPEITELSDFIQSEMLVTYSKKEVNKHIIELKGDLIVYFYNTVNYAYQEEGNLGQSCMKNSSNATQIKFYASNPTNVSLLTYIEDKKLYARGVLWTDVRGNRVIDRIYSSSSNYATKLVAYCKANEIKTVHSPTSESYGIDYVNDCIVKLDTVEMSKHSYPYLDSMSAIDLLGLHVGNDIQRMRHYFQYHKIDYLIKNLNRSGTIQGYAEKDVYINKGNESNLKYLVDSDGKLVVQNLANYDLVEKPRLSLTFKDKVVRINNSYKVTGDWCETVLIKRYNSLRPTLLYNKFIYELQYYDKQYVVYSVIHKAYIRKVDAIYSYSLRSFVLKIIYESYEFKKEMMLRKLKSIYQNRVVQITSEGLESIRVQLNLLNFKESLMDIRKSRRYKINHENILNEGIKIKGIVIPFKHLRFVKNESNNNQKQN